MHKKLTPEPPLPRWKPKQWYTHMISMPGGADRRIHEFHWSASLAKSASSRFRERLSLKGGWRANMEGDKLSCCLCACLHTGGHAQPRHRESSLLAFQRIWALYKTICRVVENVFMEFKSSFSFLQIPLLASHSRNLSIRSMTHIAGNVCPRCYASPLCSCVLLPWQLYDKDNRETLRWTTDQPKMLFTHMP